MPSDPVSSLQIARMRLIAMLDLLAGLTTVERVAETLGESPETVHRWQRGIVAAVAPETSNPLGQHVTEASYMREALHQFFETLEGRYRDRDGLLGVTSGFYDVDHMLGGFRAGSLNVLAGRPAMGRTALALAFARGCAASGKPVLYYAGETSQEQLVERLVGACAEIDNHRLRTGYLSEKDWGRLTAAIGELAAMPLVVVDTPNLTVAGLYKESRRVQEAHGGLGLVVVDPLELLRSGPVAGEVPAQRVAQELKRLARELGTAVLAIAPIVSAVDTRRDHRPTLADIRDGQALTELADVVMLLYREEYYRPDTKHRGSAELTVARHRHGPVGQIGLYFDIHSQRFAPISTRMYVDS